jgi:very-short-patch-repair endonuclease
VRKTLSVLPEADRTEAPPLQKRGRGWNIAESRLDTLHENAREMRRNPSPAQVALGEALTRAELGKYRLKRHVVIGSAIVDFACQPLKVAVAIEEPGANPEIDRRRDKSLELVGIKVLRVAAADVLADADQVAAGIVAEMKKSYDERRARPRPTPSHGRDSARRGYQR